MNDWVKTNLGNLIKLIKDGGTPDRSRKEFFNGNVSWIVIDDISDEIFETKENLTELGLKNCSSRLWDEGDIILSTGATIGLVGITRVKAATKQGICGIKTDERIVDNEFLKYWFQLNRSLLLNNSQGSTIKEIRPNILVKLPIKIPVEKTTQSKIAAVLSSIDKAIEQTEKLIEKQKRIKRGFLHDLLTKGIDANGAIRSEATHEFKDSPLGRIPKDWEIDIVGNLFEMILGKMLNKDAKGGKNQFPYLANRNVLWDSVNLSDLETMSFSDADRQKLKLKFGDLLVCEGGAVGRTAMWRNEMQNCFFQKAIHRLRANQKYILPEFMLNFMKLADEKGLFLNFTSQTSIAHLTQEKLALLPVPLPEIEEQKQIVKIFEQKRNLFISEQKRLNKLLKLKKGLMQDLLTENAESRISNL
jgi:type I restriction enzyme, S subunit